MMTKTNWRKFNYTDYLQPCIFKTLLVVLLLSVLFGYQCPVYAEKFKLQVVQVDGKRNAGYGFNEKNATSALQRAIRSGASKIIVPNVGKPWIIDPIYLESNQEIVFEEGVIVMARKGGFRKKNDSLFEAKNKENIVIRGYGAKWLMRKSDYQGSSYEKSEWRNCLTLRGCSNVTVAGLHIASSGGDGIYIGRGHGNEGTIACNDIKIVDVQCEDHLRQGISVISARNLLISNSTIRKTRGAAPQYGIDFEPNRTDEILENCVVRNCKIEENAAGGILICLKYLSEDSNSVSITVEGCLIRNNNSKSIHTVVGNKLNPNVVLGKVNLLNNQIDKPMSPPEIKGLDVKIQ